MSKLSSWKTISFLCVFCALAAIGSPAQTFESLLSFNGTDGNIPSVVVQGFDGNFYGTTNLGGNLACFEGCGTVFKITPSGALTTLHKFDGTDGYGPEGAYGLGGMALATNGNFYGTTCCDGAKGEDGTVFKITPTGTLTTLHSFDGNDGKGPNGGAVLATDGNFYGTTSDGGTKTCGIFRCGTVFKFNPNTLTLTTLHSFCSQGTYPYCTDGFFPLGGLVQATDGNLYGITSGGGANNKGTIFKITLGGTLTTLHSFDGNDGEYISAGLVQATDGSLYGTSQMGGTTGGGCGTIGCGTIFKFTPPDTLTTLHKFEFTDFADGQVPMTPLVQATDGNFYGTTSQGGNTACFSGSGCGTVFKFTPPDTLTTLHEFDSSDGATPSSGLIQATNGSLYGTTQLGGTNGFGTVFRMSVVGLGSFVETLPTSGKVGTAVIILGNNLTGSTSVTFNGKAATFTVPLSTEIKTTVPSRATTGKVKVVTPSRTLTSNVNFRVTPTISSFSPTSGPVGTSVTITGESFITGATTVTFAGGFNGKITSLSYTKITVTVPSGAKTGRITVTTPGGTATSSGYFTVT